MNIRKTYWITTLSLVLSLALVSPFCCHAVMMEMPVQQQMESHAAHGQHSDSRKCDCGHELVKDYQKTKKVYSSQTFTLFSVVASSDRSPFPVNAVFSAFSAIQPGILSDSGPPLHLLNSVFLN